MTHGVRRARRVFLSIFLPSHVIVASSTHSSRSITACGFGSSNSCILSDPSHINCRAYPAANAIDLPHGRAMTPAEQLPPQPDHETEPQAPAHPPTGRKPLSLPPPAKAAETASGEPAGHVHSADDKAAGVAAALSAMHAAAAILSKPSVRTAISASKETVTSAVPAEPPINQNPLPPVHGLQFPITRATVATLLRDHLSAPLPGNDPIRECEPSILEKLQTHPSEVMSVAHEKIHVFPFKDVRKCWLRAWVEGSMWRAIEILQGKGEESDWVAEVVRIADMALILAGGVGRERACEWIFDVLERMLEQDGKQNERPAKRQRLSVHDYGDTHRPQWPNIQKSFPSSTVRAPPLRHPIPRHENLSLDVFQAHLDTAAKSQNSKNEDLPGDLPEPIIITSALDHWPAVSDPSRRWSNPRYLMRKTLGGRRLVPVEIGRSYTDEDWGQGIITFGEFMQKYMFSSRSDTETESNNNHQGEEETKPNHQEFYSMDAEHTAGTPENGSTDEQDSGASTTTPQTGYLAQHDLFAQIPSLRSDIAIPDYCYATPIPSPSPITKNATPPLPPGHPSFPLLNAWFGPARTISPLHTDPYHNVLVQVVGTKYVRLYPPGQRERLYPRGVGEDGVDMGNTSEVDVGEAMAVLEGWDWSSSGVENEGGLSKEEAWARGEDLKMRKFDFEESFPAFQGVEGCREAVLGPGECLYVPKGWWHYVRSLAPSFSVSFWWD